MSDERFSGGKRFSGGYTVPYDEDAYNAGIQRRIRANARKGKLARWYAEDPSREALAGTIRLKGYDQPGSFFGKMADSLDEWGTLTPGQEAACRRILEEDEKRQAERAAELAAKAAVAEWVGGVGERKTFRLKVIFVTGFSSDFGWVNVYGLEDAAGNRLIYKGSVRLGAEKGQEVEFTATIKEHGQREGLKQTILTRPKVIEHQKEAA